MEAKLPTLIVSCVLLVVVAVYAGPIPAEQVDMKQFTKQLGETNVISISKHAMPCRKTSCNTITFNRLSD